jgi:hypothetical protein
MCAFGLYLVRLLIKMKQHKNACKSKIIELARENLEGVKSTKNEIFNNIISSLG